MVLGELSVWIHIETHSTIVTERMAREALMRSVNTNRVCFSVNFSWTIRSNFYLRGESIMWLWIMILSKFKINQNLLMNDS